MGLLRQWAGLHLWMAAAPLLLVVAGCGADGTERVQSAQTESNADPAEGEQARFWLPGDLVRKELAMPESLQALNPVAVRVFSSNIYVLDHGDISVIRYDLDGRFLNRIGEGAGLGPGELIRPTDLFVRNDSLWLPTIQGGLVYRFTTDGRYIDRFRAESPLRIAGLGHDLVVLSFSTPDAFARFSAAGVRRDTFGKLVENQETRFMALSGHVREAESGPGFYYVPTYAGLIYRLDRDGDLLQVTERVEPLPFPTVTARSTSGGGLGVRTDGKPGPVMVSFSEDDGVLFVHMGLRDEDGRPSRSVIDTYDGSSGTYSGSYSLPELPVDLDVHDGVVYYLTGSGLSALRLPESP